MNIFKKLFGSKNDKKQETKQNIQAEKKNETKAKANLTTKKATDKPAATAKKTDTAPKVEVKTETKVEEVTASKSNKFGKFEIKKSKDGRYVFNLYASNNLIIATSQTYTSSSSAINGIKSVIANAGTAIIEDQTLKNPTTTNFPKWEIYLDKGNQFRFRLCASNGNCICHSQGYTTKANCKNGIESIIKFASDAEIIKTYLDKKDN